MNSEEASSSIPQEPVSQIQKELLTNNAKEFIKLEKQFQENYYKESQQQDYYIISANWLRQWKLYTGYEQVKNNSDISKQQFGQHPGRLNEDIIDFTYKPVFYYEFPKKDHPYDISLKPNLQLEQDYIVINQAMWEFLYKLNQQEGFPILRKSFGQDKRVEAHLRKINVYIIYNTHLRKVDLSQTTSLFKGKVQISNYATLKELEQLFVNVFNNFRDVNLPSTDNIRLWKLDNSYTPSQFYEYIYHQCRQTQGYDYKIELKGKYLSGSEEDKQFQEIDFNQDDWLIIELKEISSKWCFSNEEIPREDKCEYCNNIKVLKYKCACKKVAYCSQEHKDLDRSYHLNRCDHPDDSDEDEKNPISLTDQSQNGLVGLKNLGNTCFMNSGIQCLSNSEELRQYFLDNKYKSELNVNNPIGAKGKLAKSLAILMKKMWYGTDSVVSPFSLKREIGSFQSMFQGFGQHDSQELISYLLDGVHEDLNRVLKKPFVETKDYDNNVENDLYWANYFWDCFLQRNRSIVVDLMYGQYKSRLDCPTCQKVSITFDPFLMISVPIPQDQRRQLEIVYVLDDEKLNYNKIKIPYDKSKKPTLLDLKQQISDIIKKPTESLLFKIASNFYVEDFTFDDKVEIKELKKKGKYKNIIVRSMFDREQQIPQNNRYEIQFQYTKSNSYYNTEQYRRNISMIKPYIFDLNQTMKSIHLDIFQQYKEFYKEFLKPDLSDTENYEQNVLKTQDPPYKIFFITNAKGWHNCYYCGDQKCENCLIPYTDDKLETFVTKVKTLGTRDFKIEIELYLKKEPNFCKLEDWFDKSLNEKIAEEQKNAQQNKANKMEEEKLDKDKVAQNLSKPSILSTSQQQQTISQSSIQSANSSGINIYNCIQLFSLPEQLAEDNAWYCNVCKEPKQAKKVMQIYRAPEILILHLKRFKSGNSVFKNKVETLIDFPVNGLNMNEYVIDRNKPGSENDKCNNNPLLYDLYAVVNHFGSVGFGHYTAFAKNSISQKWYYFDDSTVTEEQDLSKIVTSAAYVLFYRRRK